MRQIKMPPPPKKNPSSTICPTFCRHSPAATLDLLILILVLFSTTFLIISYFSYLFNSLSLILPPLFQTPPSPTSQLILFVALLVVSFLAFLISFEICCGRRSRKCGKEGCKGLKKAMEFDLQLQGDDILRIGRDSKSSSSSSSGSSYSKAVRDVDELPWKGGREDNPNYECLRSELRKMAPVNGRAVLLFRSKCGCPVSKLEGWGPKRSARSRHNKKSLALTSEGDHR